MLILLCRLRPEHWRLVNAAEPCGCVVLDDGGLQVGVTPRSGAAGYTVAGLYQDGSGLWLLQKNRGEWSAYLRVWRYSDVFAPEGTSQDIEELDEMARAALALAQALESDAQALELRRDPTAEHYWAQAERLRQAAEGYYCEALLPASPETNL